MIVLLNGKRLESSLVDWARSAAMMMGVPAAYMGHAQPLHIGAEGAVKLRPNNQVPVVGHQGVAHQPHGGALPGFSQNLLKSGVIGCFSKQGSPAHSRVEDVVDIASIGASGPSSNWVKV